MLRFYWPELSISLNIMMMEHRKKPFHPLLLMIDTNLNMLKNYQNIDASKEMMSVRRALQISFMTEYLTKSRRLCSGSFKSINQFL